MADFVSAEQSGHVLPPPQEIYDKKSYLGWRVIVWRGKQLFKFYWAGCKCLKTNFDKMMVLNKGVAKEGWILSRREKRFIARTQGDLWRIVPFVFFLMTLEEILPLMVLYTPGLLPTTTILPSQFLRIKSQEETNRRVGLLQIGQELERIKVTGNAEPLTNLNVGQLSPEMIKGLCRALNLGTMAPLFYLKYRLTRTISNIIHDDQNLLQDKPDEVLEVEEKRLALGERGLLGLRIPQNELDQKIDEWRQSITSSGNKAWQESRVLNAILRQAEELRTKNIVVDKQVVGEDKNNSD